MIKIVPIRKVVGCHACDSIRSVLDDLYKPLSGEYAANNAL